MQIVLHTCISLIRPLARRKEFYTYVTLTLDPKSQRAIGDDAEKASVLNCSSLYDTLNSIL